MQLIHLYAIWMLGVSYDGTLWWHFMAHYQPINHSFRLVPLSIRGNLRIELCIHLQQHLVYVLMTDLLPTMGREILMNWKLISLNEKFRNKSFYKQCTIMKEILANFESLKFIQNITKISFFSIKYKIAWWIILITRSRWQLNPYKTENFRLFL